MRSSVSRLREPACLAVAAALLSPLPAQAAGATVSVSPGSADPDYATVLTLRGTGFQSIPQGHGGIYVVFGWVSNPGGGWQPSQGGSTGETYRYVQDSEAKDNNGFQRFVSFPGSDTATSANGGVVAADGTWSTQLVVPGARFKTVDRAGGVVDVDCTKVQCGVITVGAHGVVNTSNETFTPVNFAVPHQQQAPPPSAPPPSAPPTQAAPPSAAPAPVVKAARTELVAGESVVVQGSGFTAGEDVAVVLHSDPVTLPPVKADANGAFSYTAVLPAQLPEGAHRLVFTGARSTVESAAELTVRAAAPPIVVTTEASVPVAQEDGGDRGWIPVLVTGAVLLIVAGTAILLVLRKRAAAAKGN
ncbi:hypothetical protein [Amycolatopsis sp. 195334CR]|uniref:hypothetical protein n=1 Tax=Amycolatopsis sp. 195334CR TaxID=2814588 RepID=UPI001A8F59B4|nr:hypothetical protein [Amycolatopsis sp. 195334CR]MBN6039572.1 hypothetical protein [Amycolatopsis sp. 195334CR]